MSAVTRCVPFYRGCDRDFELFERETEFSLAEQDIAETNRGIRRRGIDLLRFLIKRLRLFKVRLFRDRVDVPQPYVSLRELRPPQTVFGADAFLLDLNCVVVGFDCLRQQRRVSRIAGSICLADEGIPCPEPRFDFRRLNPRGLLKLSERTSVIAGLKENVAGLEKLPVFDFLLSAPGKEEQARATDDQREHNDGSDSPLTTPTLALFRRQLCRRFAFMTRHAACQRDGGENIVSKLDASNPAALFHRKQPAFDQIVDRSLNTFPGDARPRQFRFRGIE